jgi:tetratricopeptide (TPR) repeat protein
LFPFDEARKSYYEVLGIPKTAAEGEIKRAYFSLVRKYQPDRFPEEFKEIRSAYETLSDRQKRAAYDDIGNLPSSVEPLFHEAQRLDHFGRHAMAAELYRTILKSHPELDNVREEYARSFSADDKTGKAAEVWEELCRRRPDNPKYARELCRLYLDRGWHKKAQAEAQRALALDRSSIKGWNLLVSIYLEGIKLKTPVWEDLELIANEALEAVKEVKTEEWNKIPLLFHAFIAAGIEKINVCRGHLREIIRLIRENGRQGRDEGQTAFGEILFFIPPNSLAELYPELQELAGLFPDLPGRIREKLDAVELGVTIKDLPEKNYHEIFRDLFRILNSDFEEEGDELEVTAIEYHLLKDKRTFDPQIRRLKEEFPELYALHAAFFNAALRVKDPENMLFQRSKKIRKLRRTIEYDDDEPEPEETVTVRRSQPKVGRNDPCPCGSGKKYKHCCGA